MTGRGERDGGWWMGVSDGRHEIMCAMCYSPPRPPAKKIRDNAGKTVSNQQQHTGLDSCGSLDDVSIDVPLMGRANALSPCLCLVTTCVFFCQDHYFHDEGRTGFLGVSVLSDCLYSPEVFTGSNLGDLNRWEVPLFAQTAANQ